MLDLLPRSRRLRQTFARLDRECPHCHAVRESLRVLRALTGELATEDVQPSLDLTGRIMAAVRSEVRRRDLLPLPTPEPGEIRASTQAVASVLRFAADTVDGVRARHCRVTRTAEFAIEVEMTIAVCSVHFSAHALEQVRARVTAAAARQMSSWPSSRRR